MNTLLIPFAYGEQMIRTELRPHGPLFVIADVCAVLAISNPSDIPKRLHPDDLDTIEVIDAKGRKQVANACNESGLYQLIFQSRKPAAKEFTRWVTSEVLPTIRRTGSYSPTHQAYLGILREQIALGVPPALAARAALKLVPAAPGAIRLPGTGNSRMQATYDQETQEILDLMVPGRSYTVSDIVGLLPPAHRLCRGTMPARRSSIGKILERARREQRVERPWHSRKALYALPDIAPFTGQAE